MTPAVKTNKALEATRIAGRCESREGAIDPRALTCTFFAPSALPLFGENAEGKRWAEGRRNGPVFGLISDVGHGCCLEDGWGTGPLTGANAGETGGGQRGTIHTLSDVAVQKPFQYQAATAVGVEVTVVVLGVCNDGKRLLRLKRLGRSGKLQLC